jgi:anthranilate synthase/aminodeoxychorismate synthase-like glutamine amidotransferase
MSEYGWFIEHQAVSVPMLSKPIHKQAEHVLLIDHYDSFTQLIKACFLQLGARVSVVQSDVLLSQNLDALMPTHVVLSPGPGSPGDAHATQAFILKHYEQYPMLGVCLGHQCLIEAFGGEVIETSEICHGKQSKIHHMGTGLFKQVPQSFDATRYHSLMTSFEGLPKGWQVIAWTYDKYSNRVIMGIEHETYPLFGVQYHPEAILTDQGQQVFKHFLAY